MGKANLLKWKRKTVLMWMIVQGTVKKVWMIHATDEVDVGVKMKLMKKR